MAALDPRVLDDLRDGRAFARYAREQMGGGQNPITSGIPTGDPGTAPVTTATQPETPQFGNVGWGAAPGTAGPPREDTRRVSIRPQAAPEPSNFGSVRRGLARLKMGAALLMEDQGWLSDEATTAYLIDQAETIRQNPMPEDSALLLETLSGAKTMGEFIGATLTNIEDVPGAFGSVLGESAVQAGATLGGAVAGGIAGSAVAPGPGTLTGLIGGAGLGSFMTNVPVEVMGAWQEAAQEAGYDLQSPEALREAMGDEEVIAHAKAYGARRGVPIAVFDALSVGVAGRIGGPVAKIVGSGAKARTAGLLAELGAQAGAGAAGEAGAQYLSEGEITSPGDIMLEGGVEFFFGIPEVAVGSAFGGRLGRSDAPPIRTEETEVYGDEGEGGEPPEEAPPALPQGPQGTPPAEDRPTPDLPLFARPERSQADQPGVYRNADRRTGQTDLFGTTALGTAPARDISSGEQFSFDLQEDQGNLGTSGLARQVDQTIENVYLPTPEDIFQAPTDAEAARLRDTVAEAASGIAAGIDNIALMADANQPAVRRDIAAAERLLGTLNETLEDADRALGDRRSLQGPARTASGPPTGVQARTSPRAPGEVPLGPVTQPRGRMQLGRMMERRRLAAEIQRGRDAGQDVSALETQLASLESQMRADQGLTGETALERGEAPALPQGETQRRLRFEQGEQARQQRQSQRRPQEVAGAIQNAREATRGLRVTARSPQGGEIISNLRSATQNIMRQVQSDFEQTAQSGADQTYGQAMDALYAMTQALDRVRTQATPGSIDAVGQLFGVARKAVRNLEQNTGRNYSLGKIGEVLRAANPNRARAAAADAAATAANVGAGREITGETLFDPRIRQVETDSGENRSQLGRSAADQETDARYGIDRGREVVGTAEARLGGVRNVEGEEQLRNREQTEQDRELPADILGAEEAMRRREAARDDLGQRAIEAETEKGPPALMDVQRAVSKRRAAKRSKAEQPLQRKDLEPTQETPPSGKLEVVARNDMPVKRGRPRKRPRWTEGMPPLKSLSKTKIAKLSVGEKARYAMSLGLSGADLDRVNATETPEQMSALLTDILQGRAGRIEEGTREVVSEQLGTEGLEGQKRGAQASKAKKARRNIMALAKELGIPTVERKIIIDPTVRQRGVARKKDSYVPRSYADIKADVTKARRADLEAQQAKAGRARTPDDIVQEATEGLTDDKSIKWAVWFDRAMKEGVPTRVGGKWLTLEQLRDAVQTFGKDASEVRQEVEGLKVQQGLGDRNIRPGDVVIVDVRTTQGVNQYRGAIVENLPKKPGGNYEVVVDGPNNTSPTMLVKDENIWVRREPQPTIRETLPTRMRMRRAQGDSGRQDRLNRRFTQRVSDLSQRRGQIALNEALDWIAKNGPARYRPLALALRRLGLQVPVVPDSVTGLDRMTGGTNTAGTYNEVTREVRVSMDGSNPIQALLHEAVHAATISALANNPSLLTRVETLMKRSERLLQGSYGLTDATEFVTAAFTDPQFQRALEAQPARDTRTGWEAFKDVVRAVLRFIGVPLPRNLAQEVLSLQPALFETEAQIRAAGPITVQQSNRLSRGEAVRQTNRIRRALDNSSALTGAATAVGGLRPGFTRLETSRVWDNLKEVGLGLATRDQIVDMGKRLFNIDGKNALTRYARLMAAKTAKTHRYQALSDAVNRAWANFQAKYPEVNLTLNAVMLNATLHNYDPDPQAKAELAAENARRKAAGLKELKSDVSKKAKADLDAAWNSLNEEGKEVYRTVRDELRKDWQSIHDQMMANILRAWGFKDEDAPLVGMGLKRKADVMALEPPTDDAKNDPDWHAGLYRHLAPVMGKSKLDVYFPLRRHGKYVIVAKKDGEVHTNITADQVDELMADSTVKIVEQNENPNGTFDVLVNREYIAFTDDKGEAKQWDKDLKESGRYTDVYYDIRRELTNYGAEMGNLGEILDRAEKAGLDARSINMMRQVFIEWMPDTSFKKAELRRRKVAGADSDMRRGFAQYVRSAAYYKAQLEYGREIADAVRDIGKAADEARGTDKLTMRQFANEIIKRDHADATFMTDPKWVQTVSDIGYAWYLISPSYWFVNSTQPALVTMPYLSGRYGTGKSMVAMNRAYRAIMRYGIETAASERLGYKQLKDRLRTGVPGDDLFNIAENAKNRMVEAYGSRFGEGQIEEMLNVLTERGLVDLTFAMDLRDVIERGSDPEGAEGTSRVWAGIMDAGRTMPHLVEVINRMTTAAATYDLARQRGDSHRAAVEEAAAAVSHTQFNYGADNKPRYFTSRGLLGVITRPVLMFKQYAQHMYYLLGKNLYDAFKGADKETRRVGRNTFIGVLMSHSLVAGAAGGLMVEPIKWAFGLAQMLFEDDDEPWQLEQVIQSTIADMTNSPRVADAVMHGAPRLLGMDLSSRVSLNNLLLFDTYGATAEEQAEQQLIQLFGPIGNIFLNTAKGIDQFNQGNFTGGMERLLPKGISDMFQSYEEATKGVLDTRGNVIVSSEDLSPLDTFLTAMGLSPAKVASTYEYRTAVNERLYGVRNQRSSLLRRFRQSDDKASVVRDIQEFNRRHPRERITMDSLRRSLRTGMEREAATVRGGGVFLQPEEQWAAEGVPRVY